MLGRMCTVQCLINFWWGEFEINCQQRHPPGELGKRKGKGQTEDHLHQKVTQLVERLEKDIVEKSAVFCCIWYIFCWWGFLSHSCRIGLHFQNKLSLISQYWAFNDGEFAVHFHNHVDVETDFVDVLFRWWSPLPGDFFGILYPLSLAALQKSLNLRFRSRRTVYGGPRWAKKMGIKAG